MGRDWAFGLTDYAADAAALLAENRRMLGRYAGPAYWGKCVQRPEIDAFLSAGIDLLVYFEEDDHGPDSMQGGYPTGVRHAGMFLEWAGRVGAPDEVAGFFACDFNPDGHIPAVLEYMRGVGAILPHSRIGFYGNDTSCQAVYDASLASYYVQCRGWSGVPLRLFPHRDVFQWPSEAWNNHRADPLDILSDDFGQWRANHGMTKEDIVALFGSTERDAQGNLLSVEERYGPAKARYDEALSSGRSLLEQVGQANADLKAHTTNHGGAGGGIAQHSHVPGGVA